ncbi:MAG: guanylate kinase, partial [Kiritimatiellae bacterium]|nr:guanylate kinase [Kiritimatiellia bacterium]
MYRPLLIVVSAPSGAGKSTLCDRLLAERKDIHYSISCTTRQPRGLELDGRDYSFITDIQFQKYIKEDAFLEYASVHGNMYGTLKRTVTDALAEGITVVMDIDIQGAKQIRDHVRLGHSDGIPVEAFMDIFIVPPSMDELERRIRTRGEDEPDAIICRLDNARKEMESVDEYS